MFRTYSSLQAKIDQSKFRSSFHLKEEDIEYINRKGFKTMTQHAFDFVEKRLAPSYIENDGKQTASKGHPVFIAQHATACCCLGCLEKWHHIPQNKELTDKEKEYIVSVLMHWINNEYQKKSK